MMTISTVGPSAGTDDVAAWRVCPSCPAGENLWPATAFSSWYRVERAQSRPKEPCCNACLYDRYPRVYRGCSTCGALMFFHSKQSKDPYPQCRTCTRSGLPTCELCKALLQGRGSIEGRCIGCHLRGAPLRGVPA
jgi:hypothetical protein